MTNELLVYTRRQVSAFLEEIERLKDGEFPYPNSRSALVEIAKVFSNHLDYLEKITPTNDAKVVRRACDAAVDGISYYLPILGFILRSTNVRNAFEIYGPILQLAQKLLGPSTKLIISSEWKYSPFIYVGVKHLPDFVFIGLPAPESGNPFLVPLAGHELGHSIWTRYIENEVSVYQHYVKRLIDTIVGEIRADPDSYNKVFRDVDLAKLDTDLIAWETWQQAFHWGLSQAEECFCDFVGVRLFGESFLHALAYILCPMHSGLRSLQYPNTKRRIQYLAEAAKKFSVKLPDAYDSLFEDLGHPKDLRQQYLVRLADKGAQLLIPDLISKSDEICTSVNIPLEDPKKVGEILESFRLVTPGRNARYLGNILNAAWKAFHDPSLWSDLKHLPSKEVVLNELVFKTIEVFEVEQMPPLK